MKRRMLSFLAGLAIVYLGVLALLYFNQRSCSIFRMSSGRAPAWMGCSNRSFIIVLTASS